MLLRIAHLIKPELGAWEIILKLLSFILASLQHGAIYQCYFAVFTEFIVLCKLYCRLSGKRSYTYISYFILLCSNKFLII